MSSEYRITSTYAEVLDEASSAVVVSAVAAEALQVDDDPTVVRVSAINAEALQVDDEPTDVRLSGLYVEVLCRVAAPQQEGAIQFFPILALGLSGELDQGSKIAFTAELALGLFGLKDPAFSCAGPPAKAWTSIEPAAKTWDCVVVPPAEPCTTHADNDTETDMLAYANGDGFAYVNGDHLKFG